MESVHSCIDTKELHFSESSEIPQTSLGYALIKRLIDISVAAVVLTAFFPVLLIIAAIIKLDSRGSVFYRRKVVGRGGRAFRALKLRTMANNIELPSVEEFRNNHKQKDDPRVTRVGKFLRKTSIDEIPQLINVLKGEMSLVGPRMISFPELEKFGIWQDKILSVKPGITGLWQVSGRSDLPYEERVRLNLYYVEHRSILMDLKILALTIPAVLSMRGAY